MNTKLVSSLLRKSGFVVQNLIAWHDFVDDDAVVAVAAMIVHTPSRQFNLHDTQQLSNGVSSASVQLDSQLFPASPITSRESSWNLSICAFYRTVVSS